MTRAARPAATALVLVLLLSACGSGKISNPFQRQRLAEIEQATAKYENLNAAVADGYRPLPRCIDKLGLEYLQLDLASDRQLDLLTPEQLFYREPPGGGRPVLEAVGYFIPDEGQKPPQSPLGHLDGPVPGQYRGESAHFELHAWVHARNPDGVLAFFNPDVTCP